MFAIQQVHETKLLEIDCIEKVKKEIWKILDKNTFKL